LFYYFLRNFNILKIVILLNFNYLIGNKYFFYMKFLPYPLLSKIQLLLNKIIKQDSKNVY